MKKLLLLLSLVAVSLAGTSQTVGGVKISEIDAEYVDILGYAKLLKPFQVTLIVNYGQYGSFKEAKEGGGNQLKDADGNVLNVNGMMGAVNLFAENGWELHSTMLLTEGQQNVYHYIMKKKQ